MKQLFVDLDGVLAEFDGYYSEQFGVTIDRNIVDPPNFWDNIRAHGQFYRNLPVKDGALELWEGAKQLHPKPIILTGCPTSVPGVAEQKREWVNEHIDWRATLICCQSKHKRLYGKPGDILIDDWEKYKHLWEEMGGIFVLHTSVAWSLEQAAKHLGVFYEVK